MIEKITDKRLLHDIVWEDSADYDIIESQDRGSSRWHVHVETIFKRNSDDKLFIAYWRRGATENQDHELPDEAVECEEYTVTVVKYRPKKD